MYITEWVSYFVSRSIFLIYTGLVYFFANIPYGINVFTDVVQQERAFKCEDFDKAFKLISSQRVLLQRLGVENPSEDYSMAKRIDVTNAGDHLIGNIYRVIEYYNAQHKGEPISSVALTGWGCSIVGIHELLTNELGIETDTPKEILGIRFNRKVEMSASMLQYLNYFGGVFRPVGFISRSVAEKTEKKGSMTGAILIFGLLFLLAAVVSIWSYLSLMVTTDERDTWQARYNALESVQAEYNELMAIENNYTLYRQVKQGTDLNNNHLHELIDFIEAVCPKSFNIDAVTSDGTNINATCVSTEKLSSLSALIIQLNKIDIIENVWIEAISEDESVSAKKKQYRYTLTCNYVPKEPIAAPEDLTATTEETTEEGGEQ